MNKVQFVRLHRPNTGSWVTYKLEWRMGFEAACSVLKERLPGWESVSGALDNPDEDSYERV